MKQPIKIIRDMVDKYPNDMELGARVRWYIKWLYESITEKNEEYKIIAAETYLNGGKILIAQHGGNIGMAKNHQTETHQLKISTHFYSYGWDINDGMSVLLGGFFQERIDSVGADMVGIAAQTSFSF